MNRSINQTAQDDGDTSGNEAQRIRDRQTTVARAWRTIAYEHGEGACTLSAVAALAELPAEYVVARCAVLGYALAPA